MILTAVIKRKLGCEFFSAFVSITYLLRDTRGLFSFYLVMLLHGTVLHDVCLSVCLPV